MRFIKEILISRKLRHLYIIKTKWFRIYFRGSFSIFEINFGGLTHTDWVIHFFTKKGFIVSYINRLIK